MALLAILLTACGAAPAGPRAAEPDASAPGAARPAASSSALTAHGPFAVFAGSLASGQVLTILGPDGRIYGKASPHGRTGDFAFQPSVSTSDSAVYYLDGDSALMRLRPGGSPEHVRDLPGSSTAHAVVAVSPDDHRIAVSLLTYGPTPSGPGIATVNYLGMKLYVEDMDGSHHIDLFESPTVAEWPVGWHGAALVIAVSLRQIPGLGLFPYPYFAFGGIHLVDAATGATGASLCGGAGELGLATPAGVLCARGATVLSDWAGKETSTGLNCSRAALQPGGAGIACGTSSEDLLWNGGSTRTLPASAVGWVGPDRLLLSSLQTGAQLYDVVRGALQPVDMVATWTVGAIPGGL